MPRRHHPIVHIEDVSREAAELLLKHASEFGRLGGEEIDGARASRLADLNNSLPRPTPAASSFSEDGNTSWRHHARRQSGPRKTGGVRVTRAMEASTSNPGTSLAEPVVLL
jgi:hypothetical protein